MSRSAGRGLELWGGIEATIARVGNDYRDQAAETGHARRFDDLDAIAELGIKVLRYPALWENISPDSPEEADFTWHDARFQGLNDLGIEPIVGLSHHGSGPRYSSLLDPAFPQLLARHAARVAERYPHVRQFTPVNEPLTTARFSLLYGHWHPHLRDHDAFLRGLVNECRATQEAMRAIRAVREDATLVQTEDIGRTFSTPKLRYQADHDNERRWLTFDLLFGRVDRHHLFWAALVDAGVPERDLDLLLDGDAAPDIIGVNHYLTSDRYLDQRLRRYPPHHWGGNGRHEFADVEAVRIDLPPRQVGPAARLQEVWERYESPMAVTEVHHGCTRDEQLRWLAEVWDAARRLRASGADIRAVTVWAIFGVVDWNSLLTRRDGLYEPGAYDVRGPAPRLTALGKACRQIAAEGAFDHPVLDEVGWWRRDGRFYRAGVGEPAARKSEPRPVLLVGGGAVSRLVAQICEHRGLKVEHLTTAHALPGAIETSRCWAVMLLDELSTGGARPGTPGADLAKAARVCRQAGLSVLTFSPDYEPLHDADPMAAARVRPPSVGSQTEGVDPDVLLVRTGTLFGTFDETDPALTLFRLSYRGERTTRSEAAVTPTYLPDLLHVALDLLIDEERGVWHVANAVPGVFSWRMFAERLAWHAKPEEDEPPSKIPLSVRSPFDADRDSHTLPDVDSAIARFAEHARIHLNQTVP